MDDESPGATLSASPATVWEHTGDTTVTVTATLAGGYFPVARKVTIDVGQSGDGATEGTDYATVSSFEITVAAGTRQRDRHLHPDPDEGLVQRGRGERQHHRDGEGGGRRPRGWAPSAWRRAAPASR